MLTLPQAVLLLSLHDERGTIHPSAYIALDMALCGAIVAELRVRRVIGIRGGQLMPREPKPTGDELLDRAWEILQTVPGEGGATAWVRHLKRHLPDVRERVIEQLVAREVLVREVRRRRFLDAARLLPTRDAGPERELEARLRATLLEGGRVDARMGCLVSLVCAANLLQVLFDGPARVQARRIAMPVMLRDPVGSAVAEWLAWAEGTSDS